MEISEIKYIVRYCVKPNIDCKEIETSPGKMNVTIEDLEDRQLFQISVAAIGRNGDAGSFTDIKEHTTDGMNIILMSLVNSHMNINEHKYEMNRKFMCIFL